MLKPCLKHTHLLKGVLCGVQQLEGVLHKLPLLVVYELLCGGVLVCHLHRGSRIDLHEPGVQRLINQEVKAKVLKGLPAAVKVDQQGM